MKHPRYLSIPAWSTVALMLLAGWIGAKPLLGQVRSATVSGHVTDSSNAAVPGAAVTVSEQSTNQSYQVVSNAVGEFTVPYLPAGVYAVLVKKEGFATFHQRDLSVATAQIVRVNVTLAVGAVETSVTVSAAAAQLQTESAAVSNSVDERVIQTLPNVNHNPLFFAMLQQGMVARNRFHDSTGPNSFGIGIEGRRQFSAFGANGGAAFTNDVQVDGVSVQGSAWNEVAVIPNPEGVQEVRTNINNFSAEYGRGQSVVSVTTKSGTNEFHGSGFLRHRNDALNANSWGNNARNLVRPELKVYSYGGTVGGPIRRDRAFFFASYEGLNFDQGVNFLRTVPTELERKGNFSQTFANVRGQPVPMVLFDPYNVVQEGPNTFRRLPVPSSIIPRPHPAILTLYGEFPKPNRTPDDAFNNNNFVRSATRTFRRHNINSRVDYRPTQQHSLYFTGGLTKGDIDTPSTWTDDSIWSSGAEGFARLTGDKNPYASVGDTWVISASTVMDIRYGFNRLNTWSKTPAVPGFDYGKYGIPAGIQAAIGLPGVPPTWWTAGNSYWSPLENNAYQHKHERQNNHHLAGSITKTTGAWSFKSGAEFRNLMSNYTDFQSSVTYRLDGRLTAGPLINASGDLLTAATAEQAGHAQASLLLGASHLEMQQGFAVKPALSQKYFALYTQNDWRPTSRLTLNFGLRWDFQAPPTDRYNRISSLDLDATNPFGGRAAYFFPGVTGDSRYLWRPCYRDFGPRFGLAYRITNTLVLRTGYGLVYLPTNTGYFDGPFTYGMGSFAPFLDWSEFGSSPRGVVVGDFGEVTRVVWPTGADARAPGLYGSSSLRFNYRNYRNGKAQQWNLFLQKQWAGRWLFSAGYAASRGTQLPARRVPLNDDQYIPADLLQQWRQDYIQRNGRGHQGTDQVPNPFQPDPNTLPFVGSLRNRTIERRQTLWPYPYFQTQIQQTHGFSNYHSMQLQASRAFSGGLMLSAHYTWSKAMYYADFEAQQNGYNDGTFLAGRDLVNIRNNYQLANTDVPHRLVLFYVYELPLGRVKAADPANRLLRALASGWRMGGSLVLQSGIPKAIGGAVNGSLNGRNERLAGIPVEVPKQLQRWYDGRTTVTLPSGRQITPCAFCFLKYSSDAFQGTTVVVADGSLQRNLFWWGPSAGVYSDIREPKLYLWNASVQRTFRFSERFELEFSANLQNVLNKPIFQGVNAGLGNTEVRRDPSRGILPGYGDSSNFGTHGTTTVDPRQLELALKFRF